MKLLNGRDLADFIKERQARQVRALRQAHKIFPKLAIVQTADSAVIDSYVRLKQAYGEDILIAVEHHKIAQSEAMDLLKHLNADPDTHGIIVQLPLADTSQTDSLLAAVNPLKDVDGLAPKTKFEAATPLAINWLLAGYNIDLAAKKIAIVGNGKLVGQPLSRLWRASGLQPTVFDETTGIKNLRKFDLIVSATGQAGLINSDDVAVGAIVVDAGTSSEHGKLVGDVADSVRDRDDLIITPLKGGVGPLTVAALFDNVIQAARQQNDLR